MFEPTMEELDNIRNQREVNIAVMILLKYKKLPAGWLEVSLYGVEGLKAGCPSRYP